MLFLQINDQDQTGHGRTLNSIIMFNLLKTVNGKFRKHRSHS